MQLQTVCDGPTHFAVKPSQLDYFLVANQSKCIFNDQLDSCGLSLHDIIFMSYDLATPDRTPKTFLYRDYKRIDFNELIRNFYDL